jgi:hypothetical protein
MVCIWPDAGLGQTSVFDRFQPLANGSFGLIAACREGLKSIQNIHSRQKI